MPKIWQYQESPAAVRDVLKLVQLAKEDRCKGLSETDSVYLEGVREQIAQLDGVEVTEIFINNGPLFARALAK